MSSKPTSRRRRRHSFRPPFCPNPTCRFHHPSPDWHYIHVGSAWRKSDRCRIPRAQCSHCGRTFRSSVFRSTYWLRYRHLLSSIAALSVAGCGLRQIARTLHISHPTVGRHLARAGRHNLLFHFQMLQEITLREPVVADGFETFEFSQYFPCHYNLAVGADTHFIYFFTDSPLRRKGRMTPGQRLRRAALEAKLGRPDPKAVEKAMTELVRQVVRRVEPDGVLELRTDEHKAYPRALRRLRKTEESCPLIVHSTTPSAARRTTQNPLFAVNHTDTLLRHCQANHRRETIAFNKRRQGGLEKAAIFTVWRNVIKRQHENGPEESAAMVVGIMDRMLEWREVFRRRLFPSKISLPPPWDRYYRRQVKTAVYGVRQATHALKYAF